MRESLFCTEHATCVITGVLQLWGRFRRYLFPPLLQDQEWQCQEQQAANLECCTTPASRYRQASCMGEGQSLPTVGESKEDIEPTSRLSNWKNWRKRLKRQDTQMFSWGKSLQWRSTWQKQECRCGRVATPFVRAMVPNVNVLTNFRSAWGVASPCGESIWVTFSIHVPWAGWSGMCDLFRKQLLKCSCV